MDGLLVCTWLIENNPSSPKQEPILWRLQSMFVKPPRCDIRAQLVIFSDSRTVDTHSDVMENAGKIHVLKSLRPTYN